MKHECRRQLENGYVETWCGKRVYMPDVADSPPVDDRPSFTPCPACDEAKKAEEAK